MRTSRSGALLLRPFGTCGPVRTRLKLWRGAAALVEAQPQHRDSLAAGAQQTRGPHPTAAAPAARPRRRSLSLSSAAALPKDRQARPARVCKAVHGQPGGPGLLAGPGLPARRRLCRPATAHPYPAQAGAGAHHAQRALQQRQAQRQQ